VNMNISVTTFLVNTFTAFFALFFDFFLLVRRVKKKAL